MAFSPFHSLIYYFAMSNAKDEDVLILDFVNDSVIPNPKLSVSFQCSSQWLTVLLRFRHQSQLNGRFNPLSHCLIDLWNVLVPHIWMISNTAGQPYLHVSSCVKDLSR